MRFLDVVNVEDMLQVVLSWGPAQTCPPAIPLDFAGTCSVDVMDMITVLINWTP